jgi:hypothetical protein
LPSEFLGTEMKRPPSLTRREREITDGASRFEARVGPIGNSTATWSTDRR